MSGSKVALILGALAILAAAWMFRWSDPTPPAGSGGSYVLDRATGQWWLIYGGEMIRVKPAQ